jgi:hypothetical protein
MDCATALDRYFSNFFFWLSLVQVLVGTKEGKLELFDLMTGISLSLSLHRSPLEERQM